MAAALLVDRFRMAESFASLSGLHEPQAEFLSSKEAGAGANILVYALNRSGLVNERYERVLVVKKSIHTVRKLAQALQGSVDSKVSNIIRDLISYEMTALRALREDKQPYAQLARQLTDEFFASADGLPEALKN